MRLPHGRAAQCAERAGGHGHRRWTRDSARSRSKRRWRTFRGVARRMQVRGEAAGVTVVDDFAHHPTAIRATIEGARSRWPGRRMWVAFEPRSNTMRRRIFEDDLADALAAADGAVLGPVNRAQLLVGRGAAFAGARARRAFAARGGAREALEFGRRNRRISGRGVARGRRGPGAFERQLRRLVRQATALLTAESRPSPSHVR